MWYQEGYSWEGRGEGRDIPQGVPQRYLGGTGGEDGKEWEGGKRAVVGGQVVRVGSDGDNKTLIKSDI